MCWTGGKANSLSSHLERYFWPPRLTSRDSALAKDSLRKLIKDYPKTAEAAEARDKLKTIS